MEKQKYATREYSLPGYHIIESGLAEPSFFWRKYFVPTGSNVLFYIHGKAEIHYDTLHLYKYDGFAKDKSFQTLDKVNEYLHSLPKWNKTKYYIKDDDPLFEKLRCDTGR